MSFRLDPNNTHEGSFSLPNGHWTELLERGPGVLLGIAPGLVFGTQIVTGIASPAHHDGAEVSGADATLFARLVRAQIEIERVRARVFGEYTPAKREQAQKWAEKRGTWVTAPEPVLKLWGELAEWCERSGGFTIN